MIQKGIVAKFGGSSVQDASSMKDVARIIFQNPNISIVVISATYNTTNVLEKIFASCEQKDRENFLTLKKQVIDRHWGILEEFKVSYPNYSEESFGKFSLGLKGIIEEFDFFCQKIYDMDLQPLTRKNLDQYLDKLYSFGERISSWLVYSLFQMSNPSQRSIDFLEAPSVVKTNSDFRKAIPDRDLIRKNLQKKISDNPNSLYVTQGFIGSDLRNQITTLGREGSDFSASLFGEALHAEAVQIWTDVPGVFTTDPKICMSAKAIPQMSYDEAEILATFGAKVLFPRTLMPIKNVNIPVWVLSTKKPELGGTKITNEKNDFFNFKAMAIQKLPHSHTTMECLLTFVGNEFQDHLDEAEKIQEVFIHHGFLSEIVDCTSLRFHWKICQNTSLENATKVYENVVKIGHDYLIQSPYFIFNCSQFKK